MMREKGLLGLKNLTKEQLLSIFREVQEVESQLATASYSNTKCCGSRVGAIFMEKRPSLESLLKMAALHLGIEYTPLEGDLSKSFRENLKALHAFEEDGPQCIVISHNQSGAAIYGQRITGKPLINGGDGYAEDPILALSDLYAIWKEKGSFEGLTVLLVGDMLHSRLGRSLLFPLQQLEAHVRIVGPVTLVPREFENMGATVYSNMGEALSGVDVVRILPLTLPLEELVRKELLPNVREYDLFFGLNEKRRSYLDDLDLVIGENVEEGLALHDLALVIVVFTHVLGGGEAREAIN